ncbi:MAG: helix-turn-helix transcriptional regulator [Clostridia bacterium]|nr:helix-turn-helix transcriptional regulator [Clostridia bacterium]
MRSKRMNSKMNIIGKNVKKYRLKSKLTQQQLCDKLDLYGLNLYHSDIYLIEYGKRIVRDYEALALAKVFDISLDKIYEGTEKELN